MKKIKYLVIIFISILILSPIDIIRANTNIIDYNKKGSITITLKDSQESSPVANAKISLYKIANIIDTDSNLSFKYVPEMSSCPISIDELKEVNKELLTCLDNSAIIPLKKTTDIKGTLTFNDLTLGLYLVKQTNEVEGYSKIDEFMIMLPEFIDNSWNYSIDATPKTDIIRLIDITVKKVWNNSNHTELPKEVTVRLLKDKEIIDTVKLNKENNWTYTWKNLEKSDEYNVKEINIPTGYTASYRNEEYFFTITNTNTLIKTGQDRWLIMLTSLLGIILLIIGLITEKSYSNEKNK